MFYIGERAPAVPTGGVSLPFGPETIKKKLGDLRPTTKKIFPETSQNDVDDANSKANGDAGGAGSVSAQLATVPVPEKQHQPPVPPVSPRGKIATSAPGSPPCQLTAATASEVGPPGAPGVVSIWSSGVWFYVISSSSCLYRRSY